MTDHSLATRRPRYIATAAAFRRRGEYCSSRLSGPAADVTEWAVKKDPPPGQMLTAFHRLRRFRWVKSGVSMMRTSPICHVTFYQCTDLSRPSHPTVTNFPTIRWRIVAGLVLTLLDERHDLRPTRRARFGSVTAHHDLAARKMPPLASSASRRVSGRHLALADGPVEAKATEETPRKYRTLSVTV